MLLMFLIDLKTLKTLIPQKAIVFNVVDVCNSKATSLRAGILELQWFQWFYFDVFKRFNWFKKIKTSNPQRRLFLMFLMFLIHLKPLKTLIPQKGFCSKCF